MATTVINRATYFNIGGGGQKSCSSLYMNSGGSRKTISYAYANVGGSRKQIFPYDATTTYTYKWRRYTTSTTTSSTSGQTLVIPESYLGTTYAVLYDSLPSYNSNGFILDGSYTGFQNLTYNAYIGANGGSYFGFASNSETDDLMEGGTVYVDTVYYINDIGSISGSTLQVSRNVTIYELTVTISSSYTTVTSSNRNKYPDDGVSGSYYYEYIGKS